jgi:hypothetical protein
MAKVYVDGWGGAVGSSLLGGGYSVEFFASVDKGWGHTESADVLEHITVVGGVEGAFEVRVNDIDIFVVYFCVLHHHDDGDLGVVDAALEAEAVLLVAEYAVGFCIFRACIFD